MKTILDPLCQTMLLPHIHFQSAVPPVHFHEFKYSPQAHCRTRQAIYYVYPEFRSHYDANIKRKMESIYLKDKCYIYQVEDLTESSPAVHPTSDIVIGMTQTNAKKAFHSSLINSYSVAQQSYLADMLVDDKCSSCSDLEYDVLIPRQHNNVANIASPQSQILGMTASTNADGEKANPMHILATAAMMVKEGIPSLSSSNFSAVSSVTPSSTLSSIHVSETILPQNFILVPQHDPILPEARGTEEVASGNVVQADLISGDASIPPINVHQDPSAPLVSPTCIVETEEEQQIAICKPADHVAASLLIPIRTLCHHATSQSAISQLVPWIRDVRILILKGFLLTEKLHGLLKLDKLYFEIETISKFDHDHLLLMHIGFDCNCVLYNDQNVICDDADLDLDELLAETHTHSMQNDYGSLAVISPQREQNVQIDQSQMGRIYVSDDEEVNPQASLEQPQQVHAVVVQQTNKDTLRSPHIHIIEGVNHANDMDVVHGSRDRHNDTEDSSSYQQLWQQRKAHLEKKAEERAKTKFYQWQRDERTLEDIIDGSLKEYIDLYESAHALRLQFEAEKSKWTSKIMQLLSSANRSTSTFADPEQFQYFLDNSSDEDQENSVSKKLNQHSKKRKIDDEEPNSCNNKSAKVDGDNQSLSSVFVVKKKFCPPVANKIHHDNK